MAGFVSLGTLRLERMDAVADPCERDDYIRGLQRTIAPLDSQAVIGEVEAGIDDPRNALQSAFDLADAAGAADPLDREIEMRQTGVTRHEH